MQTFTEIAPLRAALADARHTGKTVGLVPTMGAFHEGHLTLMRRAKAENDIVVVTLFVNPTQFNDLDDFDRYPRDPARDAQMAEGEGVDFLFTPMPEAIYPKGFDTVVVVRALSERLEGASRPGHFAGVATVVAKLLGITQPDRAYFGEKDWQQVTMVRRMARDLSMPVEVVGCPTIREHDGLALSSRNVYLTPAERAAAPVLYRAMRAGAQAVRAGEGPASVVAGGMRRQIEAEPLAQLDYAEVADAVTLAPVDELRGELRLLVAARFGRARLIDNIGVTAPV